MNCTGMLYAHRARACAAGMSTMPPPMSHTCSIVFSTSSLTRLRAHARTFSVQRSARMTASASRGRHMRTHHLVLPSTFSASSTRWKPLGSPACARNNSRVRHVHATPLATCLTPHLFGSQLIVAKSFDLWAQVLLSAHSGGRARAWHACVWRCTAPVPWRARTAHTRRA
jgi:hypothetical protein